MFSTETTTLLANLRAAPVLDPAVLTGAVDAHLAVVRAAAHNDPFVDLATAERVADGLRGALARWPDLGAEARLHLQAAARYFAELDDGEGDLDSIIGFDDDLEVLRAALATLRS